MPIIKIPGAAVIVLTYFPGGEGCVFLLVGYILSSIRKGRVICLFACLLVCLSKTGLQTCLLQFLDVKYQS